MSLFHVTMTIKTTLTIPIEAADRTEAKELALDMPVDEISDTVQIEDMVIERRVTGVSETAPIDIDDLDPLGMELYGDRPSDDGDECDYDEE